MMLSVLFSSAHVVFKITPVIYANLLKCIIIFPACDCDWLQCYIHPNQCHIKPVVEVPAVHSRHWVRGATHPATATRHLLSCLSSRQIHSTQVSGKTQVPWQRTQYVNMLCVCLSVCPSSAFYRSITAMSVAGLLPSRFHCYLTCLTYCWQCRGGKCHLTGCWEAVSFCLITACPWLCQCCGIGLEADSQSFQTQI